MSRPVAYPQTYYGLSSGAPLPIATTSPISMVVIGLVRIRQFQWYPAKQGRGPQPVQLSVYKEERRFAIGIKAHFSMGGT